MGYHTTTSLTDQDVGSSVIMCFVEHPCIIREGAEADDCKLSGYIHIYITEALKYFTGKSINKAFIIISIVFTIQIHFTRT